MIEISLLVAICMICTPCTCASDHVFFERGSEGIVHCPAMVDGGFYPEDTEATYWYFTAKGSSEPRETLITYFHGITTPRESNHGQYNLQNSSLVIVNVTESSEGRYSYRYIPWHKPLKDGFVEVSENVSCKAKRPAVSGCKRDKPLCEVEVPSGKKTIELTCSVEHAKPAVHISWFRLSSTTNTWEKIPATPFIEQVSCIIGSETDCFQSEGTFSSKSTLKASLEDTNSTFMCVTNTSKLEPVTVTVIKSRQIVGTDVPKPTEESHTTGYDFEKISSSSPPAVFFGVIAVQSVINAILLVLLCFKCKENTTRKHQQKKMAGTNQPFEAVHPEGML